jgi:hypothetical protein
VSAGPNTNAEHIIDIVLGLLALVVIVGALAKIGRGLGREHARWLGVALPILGLMAVPSLIGWALDQFGVVRRGVVVDRREAIERRADGGWRARYAIAVRLPGSEAMIRLPATAAVFDNLHFGDPVEIRSLGGRVRRLEAMPSSGWMSAPRGTEAVGLVAAMMAILGGLALMGMSGARARAGAATRVAAGRARLLRGVIGVGLIVAGSLGCARRLRPYRGEPEPRPPLATGRGTVRSIWEVGEAFGLAVTQPYLLVGIELTPAGARSSVLAVDAIDAGSVANLQVGDQLEVQYSAAAPRQLRLGFGRRTFGERNRGVARVWLGAVLVIIVAAAAVRWRRASR